MEQVRGYATGFSINVRQAAARLSIALAAAALTLCAPWSPLSAQSSSVTIEAESMALASYVVDPVNAARIMLTAASGTATKVFSGPSGTYNIQVHVVLENDGQSTLEVFKGATRLQSYTYPFGTTNASFTIGKVALATGDTIRLAGRANGGAWARVDKIVLTSATSTPTTSYSGTPYSGTPIALPKAFPAANFDKGGQGVAYKDLTAGNAGGLYRPSEDVDIVASSDSVGGAYAINSVQSGEWLAYTVNVPASGKYDLAIRASSNQSAPAAFHIEVDGVNVTGTIAVPKTASWTTFQWVGKQGVSLAAGKRVLKIVSEQQYFNVNAASVLASATATPTPTPSTATPLTIEAESMTHSSYAVESTRIKLSASSGSATRAFSGASGTYNMQVYVLPESDGRPSLEVYKGATRLTTYTYPLGTDTTASPAVSFTLNNVALANGETIKLLGRANGGAWARVDKIVLTPTSTPPIVGDGVGSVPTPTPSALEPVAISGKGYRLVKNWDFVAGIRSIAALQAEFYPFYVYANGTLNWLNDEWQRYRDFTNGNHVFTAEGLALRAFLKSGQPLAVGNIDSGMLRSKWSGQYGYFEAKVKVPSARGTWPAFWLNPQDQTWPPEIDVLEIVNNGRDSTLNSFHIVHGAGKQPATYSLLDQWSSYRPGFDYKDGFHTFAVEWTPDRVRHFVDDKLIVDRPYRWIHDDNRDGGPAHALLNLAVGGSWPGAPTTSSLPAELVVKHIRVWQK